MLSKKNSTNQLNFIFLSIMLIELVLGGTGRLLYIPVRMMLFAIGLITLSVNHKNIKLDKNGLLITLLLISYLFIQALLGSLRGNNIGNIYDDMSMYTSILYVVILSTLSNNNIYLLKKIINIIINTIVVTSIITVLVFIWGFILIKLGIADPVTILNEFDEKYNYGIITWYLYGGDFIRVYFSSGMFMQIGLALLLCRYYIDEKEQNDLLKIIIILLGLGASGTRGYWLGSAIVVLLTLISSFKLNKSKIKSIAILIVLILGSVIFLDRIGLKEEVLYRAFNMFDFKADVSNNTRSIQGQFLLDEVVEKPILGWGLGKNIPEYTEYTGRDSRHFELFYVEQIMKLGLVGLLILVLIIIYYILKAYKICNVLKKSGFKKEYSILKGWTIGLISLLIINASNPYISGAAGFSVISIYIYIIQVLGKSLGGISNETNSILSPTISSNKRK